MTGRRLAAAFAALVILPVVVSAQKPIPVAEIARPNRMGRDLPADRVVSAMRIRPGACVLQLGAGDGTLSCELARASGNSGSVLAAEFAPADVSALNEKFAAQGLTNAKAVQIRRGWDPASHGESPFDVALLDDIVDRMPDPSEQIARLAALTRQSGAPLFVLRPVYLPDFDASMEIDNGSVIEVLRRKGSAFPLYRHLPETLRDAVSRGSAPADENGAMRREIAAFLNACLADPHLYADLDRYYAQETGIQAEYMREITRVEEAHLLRYFLYNFSDAFEKGPAPTRPERAAAVRTANHLLLTAIFGLPRTAPFYSDPCFFPPPDAFESAFHSAGFRTVHHWEIPPSYELWEFATGEEAPRAR